MTGYDTLSGKSLVRGLLLANVVSRYKQSKVRIPEIYGARTGDLDNDSTQCDSAIVN